MSRLKHDVTQVVFRPVYKLYAWRLATQVAKAPLPKHIGLILDGNRRWARDRGVPELVGHLEGYKKAKEVLDWCWEEKIRTVTVYALSLDNISRRNKQEVDDLLRLVDNAIDELASDPRIMGRGVKVKLIGYKEDLPTSLLEKARRLEEKTSSNDQFLLLLAVSYSGRAEIVEAIKKIVADVTSKKMQTDAINENMISGYMYTAGTDDPDLIIRTGGETRLSNFLTWQSIYSEFMFMDVNWPSFRKIDFLRVLRTYQQKNRRYGS